MPPPSIRSRHLFCRKTTPATGKSWFIEVERTKLRHRSTSKGSKLVKPSIVTKGNLTRMMWKIGDIDGDGKKDYFVREKYKRTNFLYFKSGANKKIGFPKVWTRIKRVKVRMNKDGTFTISCKFFMVHKISSKAKKTWHSHAFMVGAKKTLEKYYPNAFWDSRGVPYGSRLYPNVPGLQKCYVHYKRNILTDSKGKSFRPVIKLPRALMWQNLSLTTVRKFMLQGAQRPAILHKP